MSEDRTVTGLRAPRASPPSQSAAVQYMLRELVDASPDGLALTDGAGTLVLVNRRLQEMFGYDSAELLGRPVELLIPAGFRAVHRGHRADWAQSTRARSTRARSTRAQSTRERSVGAGVQLLGLRKDETTFPAEISLSPVPAEVGRFIVAVIRDVTQLRRLEEQAAAAAADAARARAGGELHNTIVSRLFITGLLLQTAADLPADAARRSIVNTLEHLDDTIRQIRDAVFSMNPPRYRP